MSLSPPADNRSSVPPRNDTPWSITLLIFQGIPIRIHASFFLLLAYIAFIETSGNTSALSRVFFILALFGCVLLHELGHALTAKLFKISTRDIVLYPFGGVATLMSEGRPKEEFFIAIAGPAVNLILAVLIGFASTADLSFDEANAGFLDRLLYANIALAFFNLIPALPMDGGRILRSLLALMGVRRATTVAARISQVICVFMGIFAVFSGNIILVIISLLVFSNAVQEHLRERTRGAASGYLVKDVMTETPIQTFVHGVTVSQALKVALKSLQNIFPVLHGDEVIGVIDRNSLLEVGALDAEESYISGHMTRDFNFVTPDEEISKVLEKMQYWGVDSVLVIENKRPVGIVVKEKALEFVLVQDFRKKSIEESKYLKDQEF